MAAQVQLAFAYRYPFSREAKELISSSGMDSIHYRYLELAKSHVQGAISSGAEYKTTGISSAMSDYLMTYIYSRMLVSSTKNVAVIKGYANAEARRSAEALSASTAEEAIAIAAQLGVTINASMSSKEELIMGFADFLKYAPKSDEFELVNQRLSGGVVTLYRNRMALVLEGAMRREILKGLPIPHEELPPEVVAYAKTVRLSPAASAKRSQAKGEYAWIEHLLDTPIADVRHRTVNLILAPYLVNTKGLEVEQAVKVIHEFIERCKQIDPNTNVNERYIEYQCSYAKRRGLKPLSLDRARELLGDALEPTSNVVVQKKAKK